MDTEGIRADRDQKVARMMRIFSISMAIFYYVLSVGIAFTSLFSGIEETTRYLFAVMLFAYGSFRLYRVFKS